MKRIESREQRLGKLLHSLKNFDVDIRFGSIAHVLHVLQKPLTLYFGLFELAEEFVHLSVALCLGCSIGSFCGRLGLGLGGRLRRRPAHSCDHIACRRKGLFHLVLRRHLASFHKFVFQLGQSLFLIHQFFRERLRNKTIEAEERHGVLSAVFHAFDDSRLQEPEVGITFNNRRESGKFLLGAFRR